MRFLKVFLLCLVLPSVSWAGVYKLGSPIQGTTASGLKYSKVTVTCDNSNINPVIRKNDGAVKWCSTIDGDLCASSKMALAIKVCKSGHIKKLREYQEGQANANVVESVKPEKNVVKKSELDIEREKIEIEKQRIELEKQRVVLQQLQAELQKLEFELQRDSAN